MGMFNAARTSLGKSSARNAGHPVIIEFGQRKRPNYLLTAEMPRITYSRLFLLMYVDRSAGRSVSRYLPQKSRF